MATITIVRDGKPNLTLDIPDEIVSVVGAEVLLMGLEAEETSNRWGGIGEEELEKIKELGRALIGKHVYGERERL